VLVSVPGTNLSAMTASKVSGLDSDPVDEKCNAPSKFTYYYQPKAKEGSTCTFTIAGANPCFVPYDLASPPARADIANFTNDRGVNGEKHRARGARHDEPRHLRAGLVP